MLLSQVASYSLVHFLVMIIVIGAVIAIVAVVMRQMGVTIPPFVVQIFWIVAACIIGVLAIMFLLRVVGVGGL